MSDWVLREDRDGVAILTLNRPSTPVKSIFPLHHRSCSG
jgi:hypothetical protein